MKNKREQMIGEIKEKYGLDSPSVLSVMLRVPRHKFISKDKKKIAHTNFPIPIGYGQTMSQPYTVALMTHLILGNKEQGTGNKKLKKVLEVGTGSGYQAAVLSRLFNKVYTIEIIPELAERAKKTLKTLGYKNVYVRLGSGEWGWKEHSPYDAIMVTAGVEKVPNELFDQLKMGGVLVAPVGKGNDKEMTRFTKQKDPSATLRKSKKTKKSFCFTKEKKKNEDTKIQSNKVTKLTSNYATNLLKEGQFGTFRFVPFIKIGN